ncbi:hypothetical protein HHI36_023602 [Cryptolaemus montrouzieri]|uniref:Uncharacterized protein n=1 Tax=Cryptolaemus montrouzieri TaxID=559131 RepID=A0ABD2PHK1_9CUCU
MNLKNKEEGISSLKNEGGGCVLIKYKNIEQEDIIDLLRSQNSFIAKEDQLNLQIVKTSRKGDSKNALKECNGSTFEKVMEKEKAYIYIHNCKSEVLRCMNSQESNEKYGTSFDTGHETMAEECGFYKQQLKLLKGRTDHGVIDFYKNGR